FIAVVDYGDRLGGIRREAIGVLPGADAVVFRVADPAQGLPGREVALGLAGFGEQLLHQALLVVGVVDGEIALVAERLDFAAQDADAERMEGRDQRLGRPFRTEEAVHALAHLVGGLVGERHRQDVLGTRGAVTDQVGDAVRDDARLAAPGAGQHERGPAAMLDRLALPLVQTSQQVHFQTYRTTGLNPDYPSRRRRRRNGSLRQSSK